MKLYKVIRYGCDEDPDGVNGIDTVFLVRGQNHVAASDLVDSRLKELPHKKVADFSQCIYEIGEDISTEEGACIIMGPSYEHAYNYGNYPTLLRELEGEEWGRPEL